MGHGAFLCRAALVVMLGGVAAGCSNQPQEVSALAYSGDDLARMSCQDLSAERDATRQRIAFDNAKVQENYDRNFRVAFTGLVGWAVLRRQRAPEEADLALMKGKAQAIDVFYDEKNCAAGGGATVAALSAPVTSADEALYVPAASYPTGQRAPFVQVATFGREENARKTFDEFVMAGYAVELRDVTVGSRRLQQVVLGPYFDPAEMDAAMAEARGRGFNDAFFIAD